MTCLYITITQFVFLVSAAVNDYNFFPNLPAGKYNIFYKAVLQCSVIRDYELEFNLYLNKISTNTTQLRGNLTLLTPLHDSNIVSANNKSSLVVWLLEFIDNEWLSLMDTHQLSRTYQFHIRMAVKDTIGGWKDNAFLYRTPKSCSTFKQLMGAEWDPLMNSFGIYNTSCPLSPGVFVSTGYDLSRIAVNANFPKIFFYGIYKFRLFYTDKNDKENGCVTFVIELKRLWEIE